MADQPRKMPRLRDWMMMAGHGSIRLLSALPISWQLALGRRLGRLAARLAPRRRHVVDVNLRLSFPELSPQQRRQMVNAHFESAGMALFEFAIAWWAEDERVAPLGEVEGIEHLDRALASGRGVLLLTAHFTPLELGARFITFHHPFHAMYRPDKNPIQQRIMQRQRQRRSGLPPIKRDDVRGVLRALRNGRAVWYAPDQNHGRRQTIVVPFFGQPTHTITATSRLARASNALVVPYYPVRLPNGHYRVTVLPALENFPSDDAAADTLRINTLIESWVRTAPEQYLWLHRRFRSKAKGQPSPYERPLVGDSGA